MFRVYFFIIFLCTASLSQGAELKSSWFDFYPYFYKSDSNVIGIDVDLSDAIIKLSNNSVSRTEGPWHESITKLKEGKIDFLPGATYTVERANFAYFTAPYRSESNSLVMLKHSPATPNFKTTIGLVEEIKKKGLKIGTLKGFAYSDQAISDYIKNNAAISRDYSKELVQDLLSGKIDGFITDSNEARKISKNNPNISFIDTGMKTPIRLMFSKKTTDKNLIDTCDKSITKILKSGLYEQIIRKYSK